MQRIRFCHVIDGSSLNPLLYNSIKFSDRKKFEYTVISLEPKNGLQEQMGELGVRSFSLGYTSRKQALLALWRLMRFFRRERTQIVQTHLFDASLIGLAAARLARVPVTIFTGHHSHETPLHKRKLLTFVDGLSGRLLAKHTIAPSEQMKDIFVDDLKVPAAKIKVIHHGFDLESWRNEAKDGGNVRAEFGIENKIIFGAVGRLFWVKRFDFLIHAFSNIADEREDVLLLIVGGGDDQEKLQNLIDAKGLNGRVILTGRRTDIAAVINSFDVFVHVALAESFGMVYIEALALGKPVISTPIGIAPDIVTGGETGFLSDTTDPDSVADVMRKMLDKKDEWSKMGKKCIQIAEQFDVKKTQEECDRQYSRWLEEQA